MALIRIVVLYNRVSTRRSPATAIIEMASPAHSTAGLEGLPDTRQPAVRALVNETQQVTDIPLQDVMNTLPEGGEGARGEKPALLTKG